MRFSLFERHPREELSGYLDNEFAPIRVEALKAHLSSCPTCRAELDTLRNLKSQLADLPESPAPRSFALTRQMAQRPAPEPAGARAPARVAALSNGMRLAGAGMAAAFAVVMVLNFSGSGSDDTRDNSAAVFEALTTNSTTQDSETGDSFTSGALAIPSAAATGAADDPQSTAVPPADGGSGGTTAGGVGGGVTSGTDGNGLAPDATPQPLPQTGSEVVPSAAPEATDLTDKSVVADDIRSLETDQSAPEVAPTAATDSDGDGIDILLLVAIALAAGVVLAFAGSVLIPRIAGGEQ